MSRTYFNVKRILLLTGVFMLCGMILISADNCKGQQSLADGKEWKLVELRKGNEVTVIDREKLESEGFGDIFTISFGEQVTGKAAPNRFTAPYQAGANNALTIQPPAATLMASVYDPERIHEKDYFEYLINIKSWKLAQDMLELYSSDSDGKETVLVYGN
ncbi:MAG: META domain-containing protein [Treponema sp.]|jgi:heat shock protein HslJ|nr:META domain-containing protein [Treponema sp.]